MRHAATLPSFTLSQAKHLLTCLAAHESVMLLSPPGVGKSEIVRQAAAAAGLELRSLLGTQIAPEDVSGVPRIIGGRAVFCPPRSLLGDGRPFCLFLDELPACPPDVQKAFYSLLLERRIGEHYLPPGTWVVAAGNRSTDRALVRTMSMALINRVFVLPVRVDRAEWLTWATENGVRPDIIGFVSHVPNSLQRQIPPDPVPFSTPRSWAMLSRDLDLAEAAGRLNTDERRALAFGRLSAQDAALFCALCEEGLAEMRKPADYLDRPDQLPSTDTGMWFLVSRMRSAVANQELALPKDATEPAQIAHREKVNRFLMSVPEEFRFALLLDQVPQWAELGASDAMIHALREVTGI